MRSEAGATIPEGGVDANVDAGFVDAATDHDSASPDGGAPCVTNADCPQFGAPAPVFVCAYAIDAGCEAKGQCLRAGPYCQPDTPLLCACDGSQAVPVSCDGYPVGYAAKPVVGPEPAPVGPEPCCASCAHAGP